MTDNIQKLYEIAGVEKKPVYSGSQLYNPVITGYEYPPFTAEKQLELIKWFVKTFAEIETLEIDYHINDCFQISSCNSVSKFEFEFEEALANFIFNLYQDLKDDQKQEIKRILQ